MFLGFRLAHLNHSMFVNFCYNEGGLRTTGLNECMPINRRVGGRAKIWWRVHRGDGHTRLTKERCNRNTHLDKLNAARDDTKRNKWMIPFERKWRHSAAIYSLWRDSTNNVRRLPWPKPSWRWRELTAGWMHALQVSSRRYRVTIR